VTLREEWPLRSTGWAKSIWSTLKAYNLGSLAIRCILNASN